MQELRLVDGIKARPHVQLDKVHFRAFTLLTLDFDEKGGKKSTDGLQRRADVPPTEAEFVFLQFLVYLVRSEDSVPG